MRSFSERNAPAMIAAPGTAPKPSAGNLPQRHERVSSHGLGSGDLLEQSRLGLADKVRHHITKPVIPFLLTDLPFGPPVL